MTDKIQENAQSLFDMLCRAFDALDGEEDSVKEEHADLISDMGALIDSVRPDLKPREFEFNMKIFATLKITATSEAEAIALLENADMESANIGAFADGSPAIVTLDDIEDSSGGDWRAVKIDGEEI